MSRYILAAFLAVISFVLIGPFVRLLLPYFSLPVITFGRAFFGFLFVLFLLEFFPYTKVKKNTFHVEDIQDFAFTGLLLAITMTLYNTAFSLSAISDVVLLNYTHVFLAPAMAVIFLKEKMEKNAWLFILGGFIGLAIINPLTGLNVEGNILALGAGVSYAIMAVFMRKADRHHGLDDVVWFLGFASLFLLPITLSEFPTDVGLIPWIALIIGSIITGGVSYLLFNYALEGLRLHIVSTLDLTVGTMAGIFIGIALYQEVIPFNVWLGGFIVVGSGLLFIRSQHLLTVRLKLPSHKKGIYGTTFLYRKTRPKNK